MTIIFLFQEDTFITEIILSLKSIWTRHKSGPWPRQCRYGSSSMRGMNDGERKMKRKKGREEAPKNNIVKPRTTMMACLRTYIYIYTYIHTLDYTLVHILWTRYRTWKSISNRKTFCIQPFSQHAAFDTATIYTYIHGRENCIPFDACLPQGFSAV